VQSSLASGATNASKLEAQRRSHKQLACAQTPKQHDGCNPQGAKHEMQVLTHLWLEVRVDGVLVPLQSGEVDCGLRNAQDNGFTTSKENSSS
jgi:hypothetical protein